MFVFNLKFFCLHSVYSDVLSEKLYNACPLSLLCPFPPCLFLSIYFPSLSHVPLFLQHPSYPFLPPIHISFCCRFSTSFGSLLPPVPVPKIKGIDPDLLKVINKISKLYMTLIKCYLKNRALC